MPVKAATRYSIRWPVILPDPRQVGHVILPEPPHVEQASEVVVEPLPPHSVQTPPSGSTPLPPQREQATLFVIVPLPPHVEQVTLPEPPHVEQVTAVGPVGVVGGAGCAVGEEAGGASLDGLGPTLTTTITAVPLARTVPARGSV